MKALDGIGLAVVVALAATGVVLTSPGRVNARPIELDYTFDASTLDYEFGERGNGILRDAMLGAFGPHAEPRLPEGADLEGLGIDAADLPVGRELFIKNCMHCHGANGGANGTTAEYLKPRPRDFRRGLIKFSSTPTGMPPVRDDIRRVLDHGVAYTAMPSFVSWSPDFDREAVISYVQFLMLRGETEQKLAYTLDDEGLFDDEEMGRDEALEEVEGFLLDEFEIIQDNWLTAREQVIYPPIPRPEPTAESLAEGKRVFLDSTTECSACHGEDGDGRGPNVYDAETGTYKLEDIWGNAAQPADLRLGFYRGGNRPIDLYRRIRAGIRGTPMPSFDALSPEEIWAVVNYVLTLPYQQQVEG